jgi:predicted dithiol-disulfide oxidoreductase (DUF899 family)
MTHQYPNESVEYRQRRNELAAEEEELIRHVKAVAEQRRQLPPGGLLKEDYSFTWATDDNLGSPVRFSELFADHSALILYSFMYGSDWDNPCPSCTSIVDGLDRMAYSVNQDAALVVIGKAPAEKINSWARTRCWADLKLISGYDSPYQADYGCQLSDDRQIPKINVFRKVESSIYHFWGSEIPNNDIDMVWAYWNLMDLLPAGRPERPNPPQNFRSRYLEANYSD